MICQERIPLCLGHLNLWLACQLWLDLRISCGLERIDICMSKGSMGYPQVGTRLRWGSATMCFGLSPCAEAPSTPMSGERSCCTRWPLPCIWSGRLWSSCSTDHEPRAAGEQCLGTVGPAACMLLAQHVHCTIQQPLQKPQWLGCDAEAGQSHQQRNTDATETELCEIFLCITAARLEGIEPSLCDAHVPRTLAGKHCSAALTAVHAQGCGGRWESGVGEPHRDGVSQNGRLRLLGARRSLRALGGEPLQAPGFSANASAARYWP